jgi:hypothetical protein
VRVTEREPIAQFPAWHKPSPNHILVPITFYLDEEGYVLTPSDLPKLSAQLAEHFDHLPKVMGVEPREIAKGKPVSSAKLHAALRLIRAFSQSEMAEVVDVLEIDISIPQLLELTTRDGSKVTLGYEDLPKQLQRWRIVHDYALTIGRHLASLDLSVSNNVPARWHDSDPEMPAAPRQLKPIRYKKKHV